eukprot:CCRYP_013922-RA/>CCRYP_013922-RA protein AED:0.15 eAED:0.15 QI:0/0/0/1/0/0/2/0/586
MAKTGYKYTKQAPAKGNRNMLPKSAASSKLNRTAPKSAGNARSSQTIARLKMYNNGKAIRNKEGKVVGGQFMMADRAGDTKITAATGRIAPDRRWFGNTRVVAPTELDRFRQEMTDSMADPYSVVVKRKTLPMGLLRDAAELQQSGNKQGSALLVNEPFETAFGTKSQRKRVKVEQYMVARTSRMDDDPQQPQQQDVNQVQTSGEGIDWRSEKKDDLFLKGQSKRIWGEFYKVLDCSDVILHVIDARNVPGTRCTMIEKHISKNAPHKHLVFVLNKIDLVPNWVAKRWIGELAQIRPTIAFHASMTHAFGKGALISLLRQFGKLTDKKQISVGVIGYPNVGKSSVINTLISKKSCKVAPLPGETKIWQYITLFRNIYLIDCPGVVVDTAGDTETDSVLKGVVRAERLECPEEFVDAICNAVKREHIAAMYGLAKNGEESWNNSEELLEKISVKCGRLKKGGEPCLRTAAIMLINDFQRGRLPHYVAPPELKELEGEVKETDATSIIGGVKLEEQNLDSVERSLDVEEAKGSDAMALKDDLNGRMGMDEDANDTCVEDRNSGLMLEDNESNDPVALAVTGDEKWEEL